MKNTEAREAVTFHWSYIVLPVAVLLLSVILTVVFYSRLPDEVAYRFQPDGSPDKWLSRGTLVIWTLSPQLLFTLAAGVISLGITGLAARFIQPGSAWIKPERIIMVMSNMIALPQAILAFAMVDVFSYNLFQTHLLPLWIFALIVLVVGGIILGVFFLRALRQFWIASKE